MDGSAIASVLDCSAGRRARTHTTYTFPRPGYGFAYAARAMRKTVPKHELPEGPLPANVAKTLIDDEVGHGIVIDRLDRHRVDDGVCLSGLDPQTSTDDHGRQPPDEPGVVRHHLHGEGKWFVMFINAYRCTDATDSKIPCAQTGGGGADARGGAQELYRCVYCSHKEIVGRTPCI